MSQNPYRQLHIYYLAGRVPPLSVPFHHFIGNWEEDGYTFLFFSVVARDQVEALLLDQPHLILLDEFQMTYDEWQGGMVQPTRIGRFFIAPPWDDAGAMSDPKCLSLKLDPGVVFGNGTHPTTQDCLEALEKVITSFQIETAIDIGTGTGLLAMAAVKLGCKRCLALDFNHLATQTAANNIRLNGLEQHILAIQGRGEEFVGADADLLIANIHFDVMQHLVKAKGFLHKRFFILSGLMRSEVRHILHMLSALPVEVMARWERNGTWFTLLGRTVNM